MAFTGMNLQICFMNETASDGSDSENQQREQPIDTILKPYEMPSFAKANTSVQVKDPFVSLPVTTKLERSIQPQQQSANHQKQVEMDFFAQQAKLQIEARTALAQAKELARVQMQVERQQKKRSLISDLVRQSLEKVGIMKCFL